MNCLLFVLVFAALQDVPLKPMEEFDIKLDYGFKPRPIPDRNTAFLASPVSSSHGRSTSVLPYLVLNIRLLQLQEKKMRMRVSTNLDERALTRRVNEQQVVSLDLGFTDDMIDRVTAHEYVVTFFNSQKQAVSKILIGVEKDGSFLINGEKRGQF